MSESPVDVPTCVKVEVRAVLLSKKGVPVSRFQLDYRALVGEPLNFRKLGFKKITDLFDAMPDTVRSEWCSKDNVLKLYGVADPNVYISKALKKNALSYSEEDRDRDRRRQRSRSRGAESRSRGRVAPQEKTKIPGVNDMRDYRTSHLLQNGEPPAPTIPGEKAALIRDSLVSNTKGHFSVCFPRVEYTRDDIAKMFQEFGACADVSFTPRFCFIRYFDKEHVIAAMLALQEKLNMKIPFEHAEPKHLIKSVDNIRETPSTNVETGGKASFTVYVGNMHPIATSKKEIAQLIPEVKVTEIRLFLRDARPATAFIVLSNLKDAEFVIRKLSGMTVKGKNICAEMTYNDSKYATASRADPELAGHGPGQGGEVKERFRSIVDDDEDDMPNLEVFSDGEEEGPASPQSLTSPNRGLPPGRDRGLPPGTDIRGVRNLSEMSKSERMKERAKLEIIEGMEDSYPNLKGANTEKLKIVSSAAGLIIGKQGSIIKNICSETGATVYLNNANPHKEEYRYLTINGSPDQIEAAIKVINLRLTSMGCPEIVKEEELEVANRATKLPAYIHQHIRESHKQPEEQEDSTLHPKYFKYIVAIRNFSYDATLKDFYEMFSFVKPKLAAVYHIYKPEEHMNKALVPLQTMRHVEAALALNGTNWLGRVIYVESASHDLAAGCLESMIVNNYPKHIFTTQHFFDHFAAANPVCCMIVQNMLKAFVLFNCCEDRDKALEIKFVSGHKQYTSDGEFTCRENLPGPLIPKPVPRTAKYMAAFKDSQGESRRMHVLSSAVGWLIGKQGGTIREIIKTTGGNVQFDVSTSDKYRGLTIYGKLPQIDKCEALIRERLGYSEGDDPASTDVNRNEYFINQYAYCVVITNFETETTFEDLCDLLSCIKPKIQSIYFVYKPCEGGTKCLIPLRTMDDVRTALTFDGITFNGRVIRVEEANESGLPTVIVSNLYKVDLPITKMMDHYASANPRAAMLIFKMKKIFVQFNSDEDVDAALKMKFDDEVLNQGRNIDVARGPRLPCVTPLGTHIPPAMLTQLKHGGMKPHTPHAVPHSKQHPGVHYHSPHPGAYQHSPLPGAHQHTGHSQNGQHTSPTPLHFAALPVNSAHQAGHIPSLLGPHPLPSDSYHRSPHTNTHQSHSPLPSSEEAELCARTADIRIADIPRLGDIDIPPGINLDCVLLVTPWAKHKSKLDVSHLSEHFHNVLPAGTPGGPVGGPVHISILPVLDFKSAQQSLLYYKNAADMQDGLIKDGSVLLGSVINVFHETNTDFVSNPYRYLMQTYEPPTFDTPTLYVSCFPLRTSVEELSAYFTPTAQPEDIQLADCILGLPNRAFLFYKTDEDAKRGLALNGSQYKGMKLKISLTGFFKQGVPQLFDVAKSDVSKSAIAEDQKVNNNNMHGGGGDTKHGGGDTKHGGGDTKLANQDPAIVKQITRTGPPSATELILQEDATNMSEICFFDAVDFLYTHSYVSELTEGTGNIRLIVTNVLDDAHFWGWILNQENIEVLQSYLEKHKRMKEITEKFAPYDERVGVWHNNEWYRGMVCKVNTDTADVFLVDYGSHETIPVADLTPLPEFFWDDAPMAVPFRVLDNRTGGSLASYLEKPIDAVCVEHHTGQENVLKVILLEVLEKEET